MSYLKPTSILLILVSLLASGGCAALHGPGYRLEEVSMTHCGEPEFVDGEYEYYGPPLPAIPTPQWFQQWQAKRKLPMPPQSPRFQPLPTRPMFSAAKGQPERQLDCFGKLPQSESWSAPQ
jgi:hypothetical protein